ncbi:uncharacterized protein [Engystomops pustulosus]|uniref:uncharacterized protein isoform X1 n=1 Tax=Engystomops pustulosus TaxID=76066 RepID=UPI003AFB1E2D
MATWDNVDMANLTTILMQNHLYLNGDNGPPSPPAPGSLIDAEEELEKLSALVEDGIDTLSVVIVKVSQYSNRPIQDAPGPSKRRNSRHLRELEAEFKAKMEQLKQVATALSSMEPTNHFDDANLYYLIKHIKDDDWIHLMRLLKVTKTEMEECRRQNNNIREQKYQMLRIWLRKPEDGMRTYRDHLVEALGLIEYDHLCSMFTPGCTRSAPPLR